MWTGIKKGFGFTVGVGAALLALPAIGLVLAIVLAIAVWIIGIGLVRLVRDHFWNTPTEGLLDEDGERWPT
jgi:uncharacterized transporter YbjL